MRTQQNLRLLNLTAVCLFWLLSLQVGHCFYSPGSGRWLSRDPVGVFGGINTAAFVKNNPVNLFDPRGLRPAHTTQLPKKKCGVDRFIVKWTTAGSPPLGFENHLPLAHIDIQITFKTGGDYDPTCCEFKQSVKWRYTRKRNGEIFAPQSIGWPSENDDGYDRTDNGGADPYSDPTFHTTDDPGVYKGTFIDGDQIDYSFTATQIVFSKEKKTPSCECEKNDEVARRTHTMHFDGAWPEKNWGNPPSLPATVEK